MNALAVTSTMIPALVVGVSFAAGLNTYATMLALGIMARMHWVVLPTGLGTLSDTWVMAVSAVLFFGEFVADKIPVLDVIWNLLHTFIRIPAAALLAFGAGSTLSPAMQIAVAVLGAAVAAVAHGSKTAMRVAVTPSPEPISNVALSLGEDGLATGLSWMALRHPVAGAVGVCAMVGGAAGLGWWGARRIRAGWRRRFGDRRKVDSEAGYRMRMGTLLEGEAGELMPQAGLDRDAKA